MKLHEIFSRERVREKREKDENGKKIHEHLATVLCVRYFPIFPIGCIGAEEAVHYSRVRSLQKRIQGETKTTTGAAQESLPLLLPIRVLHPQFHRNFRDAREYMVDTKRERGEEEGGSIEVLRFIRRTEKGAPVRSINLHA